MNAQSGAGVVTISVRCRCGALRGTLSTPRSGNRVVCYCKDCQAFAHFLGEPQRVLDGRGGSDIVQVLPKNLTLTQGADRLAAIRLTPKGLVRWYASCCRTPIGNTLATPKFSFVGLVHPFLTAGGVALDDAFGPVRAVVHTQSAQGEPKPKDSGTGKAIGWFFGTVLKARFNGDYKHTPLFRRDTGAPVVSPHVLSADEHMKLMQAVQG